MLRVHLEIFLRIPSFSVSSQIVWDFWKYATIFGRIISRAILAHFLRALNNKCDPQTRYATWRDVGVVARSQ